VADRLIREYKARVLITGSLAEKELINEIICRMSEKAVVCTGVKLTELVSLFKRASMYIGNITGPMHIAAALNIPVVAITGLTGSLDDVRYWGPWCDQHEIIHKVKNCPHCEPGDCPDISCIKI